MAFAHTIEDGATDSNVCLPSVRRPSPRSLSDDNFVSPDGALDQRTLAIAGGALPFHPAVHVYCGDMVAALDRRFGSGPFEHI